MCQFSINLIATNHWAIWINPQLWILKNETLYFMWLLDKFKNIKKNYFLNSEHWNESKVSFVQVQSIGPLEWVLNTASHHRVHHGANRWEHTDDHEYDHHHHHHDYNDHQPRFWENTTDYTEYTGNYLPGTVLIRIMQAFSSFGTGPCHYHVDLRIFLKHMINWHFDHAISGCLEHLRLSEAMWN